MLLSLLLACGDKQSEESGPRWRIEVESSGENTDLYLGYPETFTAEISDLNGSPIDVVEVAWFVGSTVVENCDWNPDVERPDDGSLETVFSSCDITFSESQLGETIIVSARNDKAEADIRGKFFPNVIEASPPIVVIDGVTDDVFFPDEESLFYWNAIS